MGFGYRKVFGPGPDKKINLYHGALPNALSAILIQMRTGMIGLSGYLHKINRAEGPYCNCQLGHQTVPHILGDCYLRYPFVWQPKPTLAALLAPISSYPAY
jgi:hypothetical protein